MPGAEQYSHDFRSPSRYGTPSYSTINNQFKSCSLNEANSNRDILVSKLEVSSPGQVCTGRIPCLQPSRRLSSETSVKVIML